MVPGRISRIIADEEGGDTDPRRAIDYVPGYSRYSDRIEEEAEEDAQAPGNTIEAGNNHPDHVFPAHLGRNHQPSVENDWARG